MTVYYPEVMPPTQQKMLRRLGPIAAQRGFYLAGGTALALQIGHRRSADLDWFTPETIHPMVLAADLKEAGLPFDVTGEEKGTLHGIAQGVKLTFLEYPYSDLTPPEVWPEYQVPLASLDDLACMKLSAVSGRGHRKDFVDIFALGRGGFTLDQMLKLYGRKYDVSDVGHTIYALTYFDDAEEDESPEMFWQVDWDEVKATIEAWVREYVSQQAPPQSGGRGILP